MITGLIDGKSNNFNYDGTIGQKDTIHSISTALSIEQEAILNNISGQLNLKISDLAAILTNILETLGGSPANPYSEFGSASLTYNIQGDILTFVVPSSMKYRLLGARGWSEVDAEFLVKKNGIQVDGYRTTPAILSMDIDTQVSAIAGDSISISAIHFKSGPAVTFKASLVGILEAE